MEWVVISNTSVCAYRHVSSQLVCEIGGCRMAQVPSKLPHVGKESSICVI